MKRGSAPVAIEGAVTCAGPRVDTCAGDRRVTRGHKPSPAGMLLGPSGEPPTGVIPLLAAEPSTCDVQLATDRSIQEIELTERIDALVETRRKLRGELIKMSGEGG